MTQEPQQHEEVALGIDPGAPPEDTWEFVGRLSYNKFIRAPQDYADAAGGAKPIKWRQEFTALDVVREDGTDAIFSNSPSMTRADGVTPLGEGSAANHLAIAWKGLVGISMNPEDERSLPFMGMVFRLKSKRLKVGQDRKTGQEFRVRLYIPQEIVGDSQYQYMGDKRVLKAQEGADSQAQGTGIAPPPAQDEDAVAALLIAVVTNGGDGTKGMALGRYLASDMKSTPMLFGTSITGGLSFPYPLLTALIEKGLLKEEGDKLVAV